MTIFILPLGAKSVRMMLLPEQEIAGLAADFPGAIYFFARLEPMED